MSLSKYVSLLSQSSLYFCRLDRHTVDTWEGKFPKTQYEAIVAAERESHERMKVIIRQAIEAGKARGEDVSAHEKWLAEPLREGEFYRTQPSWTAINGWSENEHESAALWTIYLPGGEGVAVETSFGRLAGAFKPCAEPVHIGRVTYLDYSRERIRMDNGMFPLIAKRKSFGLGPIS